MPPKNRGFFSQEALEKLGIDLDGPNCQKCGLYKNCLSPKMKWTGKGRLKVLIIAEAPGAEEDKFNEQLIGESGNLLSAKLAKRGYSLKEDFYKINAVNCRPHKVDEKGNDKNVPPTRTQIRCCRPLVERAIEKLKPEFIWLLGGSAIESLYVDRSPFLTISTWRGICVPDPKTQAWILPMYHPSYLVRNNNDEIPSSVFDRDLDFALAQLKRSKPTFKDYLSKVEISTNHSVICGELERIARNQPGILIFDYETTGKKPFNPVHRIASISMCSDSNHAFAFPYQYKDMWNQKQFTQIQNLWRRIMLDPKIKKVAHNFNFEDLWTRYIVGVNIASKFWDTRLAQHVLDCRHNFTGLKFQAYIRWGIEGYDKSIEPFLKKVTKEGTNRVMEAPLQELLLYGGADSLLTKWLFDEQQKEFRGQRELLTANSFFRDSQITLTDIQSNGINMNVKYYEKEDDKLEKEIAKMEKEILLSSEAEQFRKDKGREIDYEKPADLRHLFFKILKLKATKLTETELESVDESVLATIDSKVARQLIQLKKVTKVKNTYIAQFLRNTDHDHRMRPFFSLHIPTTYRGSSSNPNFQNVPIRDETAKKITRSGIIPSPGNLILDWDYGSMEVRIIACYTEDDTLVAYCSDPSTDMHRDEACELFCMDIDHMKDKRGKKLRFHAKNGFVFPEFYGSYFKSCARNLYKECMGLETEYGIPLKQYLQEIGIIKRAGLKAYEDFEKHVRDVESEFWKKYKKTKRWQERMFKQFIEKGYIQFHTGFRASGYLSRNNIVNTPIQGTAFHCLLYSLNQISQTAKDEKWDSKIIGQIHDNCIYDTVPPEKKYIKEVTEYFATEQIREHWPWLIVPLIAEWEESEIDGSWYSKQEKKDEYDD